MGTSWRFDWLAIGARSPANTVRNITFIKVLSFMDERNEDVLRT